MVNIKIRKHEGILRKNKSGSKVLDKNYILSGRRLVRFKEFKFVFIKRKGKIFVQVWTLYILK